MRCPECRRQSQKKCPRTHDNRRPDNPCRVCARNGHTACPVDEEGHNWDEWNEEEDMGFGLFE